MPVDTYLNMESDTMVIAFTSMNGKLSIGPQRFFKSAGLNRTSRVVVTDPYNNFCFRGVPPKFPSFDKLRAELERLVSHLDPSQLVVTGTSVGGHPAMLFGHLLEADLAVSFAPFTDISEAVESYHREFLTEGRGRFLKKLRKAGGEGFEYLDLKSVLAEWNGKTEYKVHVSEFNDWDCARADHLKDCPHLEVIMHPYQDHSVASRLFKDDTLHECFEV